MKFFVSRPFCVAFFPFNQLFTWHSHQKAQREACREKFTTLLYDCNEKLNQSNKTLFFFHSHFISNAAIKLFALFEKISINFSLAVKFFLPSEWKISLFQFPQLKSVFSFKMKLYKKSTWAHWYNSILRFFSQPKSTFVLVVRPSRVFWIKIFFSHFVTKIF